MLRRFRQHDVRRVNDLAGVWDFSFLGNVEPDDVELSKIAYNDRMAVPGCFDATPAYAGKRGLAAYRKRVRVIDRTLHRLILDGVHHWGRVFVDGKHLRDHVGGYTRFNCDFTPRSAGEIEIVLLVDNRIDYKRCPLHLDYFDWYHFGGLARGGELHRLGTAWIDDLRVDTLDYRKRTIRVQIDYGCAAPAGKTPLTLTCAGSSMRSTVNLSRTSGTIELTFDLGGADLWSPQQPALHDLYVTLGDDDQRERVGIRQVSVRGRDILINGKAQQLLGFCRHETHPEFGCGLPAAIMVSDVQQLKDMGCNFVRGSHYPQDVRFLDLCDEAGLCVWCEPTAWQQNAEQLNDEHYMSAQEAILDEMVASARNRPSVIMWGVLNEGNSHDARCRPAYERLLGRLRGLDQTRPITFASNHPTEELCFDLADIVSINCYPGWYSGEIDEMPKRLDDMLRCVDTAGGQADKPIIISEIGAGGIYGWRDWNEARWTEQYQARLLETAIRHLFLDRHRVCGLSIWQFCDGRTGETPRPALGRPRGFNNKGVVDEYRRPKMAYDVVKELFGKLNKRRGRR